MVLDLRCTALPTQSPRVCTLLRGCPVQASGMPLRTLPTVSRAMLLRTRLAVRSTEAGRGLSQAAGRAHVPVPDLRLPYHLPPQVRGRPTRAYTTPLRAPTLPAYALLHYHPTHACGTPLRARALAGYALLHHDPTRLPGRH
eukprot:2594665-Rhodomonas_salina.1